MLKTYCQNCGSLNKYASEKPNFCNKCGIKFNHALATSDTKIDFDAFGPVEAVPYEPGRNEAIDNILKLGELDIEIDFPKRPTDTVGSLVGTGKEGAPIGPTGGEGEPEYTIEDFEKEAGSIKKQDGENEKEET